jgi:hypothetical protein
VATEAQPAKRRSSRPGEIIGRLRVSVHVRRGKPYGKPAGAFPFCSLGPPTRCRLRRTSGHATAAAGQAVKTKTYFSFRVDVWDDLRNDRAEGVSVIRIARQRCGK